MNYLRHRARERHREYTERESRDIGLDITHRKLCMFAYVLFHVFHKLKLFKSFSYMFK